MTHARGASRSRPSWWTSSRAPPASRASTPRWRAAAPAELREHGRCTRSPAGSTASSTSSSCMGIDDIQKTSGNTMAITMTEDWVREVDRAGRRAEFVAQNAELNQRDASRPSRCRRRCATRTWSRSCCASSGPTCRSCTPARDPGAARTRASTWTTRTAASTPTSSRWSTGWRRASCPSEDDFFIDRRPWASTRSTGSALKVCRGRRSRGRSTRLRRDPALLDYVSLAVPRGFHAAGRRRRRAPASVAAPRRRGHAGAGHVRGRRARRLRGAARRRTMPSSGALARREARRWLEVARADGRDGDARDRARARRPRRRTGHRAARASRTAPSTLGASRAAASCSPASASASRSGTARSSHASISLGAASRGLPDRAHRRQRRDWR